ncbi:MAG: Re/Si-specific NAD(P)(+) transhydrogenase subunit alpha, partial [Bacteroidales bacterium]|nr:Re/Si-specific NAD(P)(+) transhydrogenase subunit alpha [Bacteroidales bacterium]
MVTAGILKEPENDSRVALLPGEMTWLVKSGFRIIVEHGAGDGTYTADVEYESAGAIIAPRSEVFKESDILLTVNPPLEEGSDHLRSGQILVTMLNPVENAGWLEKVREAGVTVMGLDLVPRSTRAQSMDVLSSMATVAGYKSVLESACRLPHFFPMFMSAAGTIKPARLLVLGAGVAGLQAIATAKKLGAVVEAFDVRPAVKEEVMSLGAKFIEVEGAIDDKSAGGYAVEQTEEYKNKQRELIQERARAADVIIATAQIPGRRAPLLVTAATVEAMKKGSVIMDLAASTGGNCELTQNGKAIDHNGILIVGKSDYPAGMPYDSSKMYGNNLMAFLKLLLTGEGSVNLDLNDDIIAGVCAVHDRGYVSARCKQLLN